MQTVIVGDTDRRRLFQCNSEAAVDINNTWWNKFFSYTEQEFCSSCEVNLLGKSAWEREANGLEKTDLLCEDCVQLIPLHELVDAYLKLEKVKLVLGVE